MVYSILTFGHGHWFLEPANTGLQHSLLLSWHTTPTTEESKHHLLTAATIRHSKVSLCIAIVNVPNTNSRFHLTACLHLYDPKTGHDSFYSSSITMLLHTSHVFELLFIKLICICWSSDRCGSIRWNVSTARTRQDINHMMRSCLTCCQQLSHSGSSVYIYLSGNTCQSSNKDRLTSFIGKSPWRWICVRKDQQYMKAAFG